MTQVKVCGIKSADIARQALSAGADFLGIVMTASPRKVSWDSARGIVEALPNAPIIAVGMDVDDQWLHAILDLSVWGVQLHGRAPKGWIDTVHRANRRAIATTLDPAADIVLLDNRIPGRGEPWDWRKPDFSRPVWLAGGLSPHNVHDVVMALRPDGVDVSTGVERDGEKDPQLIRDFIQEVHRVDN